MKKLFLIFLFIYLNSFSQNFDLSKISSGKYLYMSAILDNNEKLYGYFSLYELGKTNEKEKTFEFYILDKNLNEVLSNKVNMPNEIDYLVPYINVDGDLILSPISNNSKNVLKDFVFPKSMKLDLKTNKIEAYNFFCYEDNVFVECPENKSYREKRKEYQKSKKEKEFIEDSDVYRLKNGKYLVSILKDYFKYIKDNELKFFDENKKEIWSFKYNQDGSKENVEYLSVIHYNEDRLYALLVDKDEDKYTNYILIIDIKTGVVRKKETVKDFGYSTTKRFYNRNTKFYENENYVFIFNYLYDFEGNRNGYVLARIDKKTEDIFYADLEYEHDLKAYIPNIDKTGFVENGYFLHVKEVFFMRDGSVKILAEKIKIAIQSTINTTDMVFISTDKNFKVTFAETLEKEKSTNAYTDYLFAQEINDNKDFVFYYKDFKKNAETKDKNWILFINTIINGKFKQEQIIISSKKDKFVTIPYIAKEGYILLREYNEKEKYNQIRLERLNF